jgi:hypothetical protein
MMRANVFTTICLWLIACGLPVMAQNSAGSGGVVPRLVNYSGKVLDAGGKPLAGIAGVTFAIYKDQSASTGPEQWRMSEGLPCKLVEEAVTSHDASHRMLAGLSACGCGFLPDSAGVWRARSSKLLAGN